MSYGKQIRLFLTDGSASSMRYVELVNWTGQAFACPSGLFGKLKEWAETQRPGVYVLIGLDGQGEDVAYIGESENVAQRLLTHMKNSTLEEIVEVLFFTSKDDNLTKGHITYLEKQLIARATLTKRYPLRNDVTPSDKLLSKPEIATMQEYLENLYLVSQSLGFDIFVLNTATKSSTQHDGFSFIDLGLVAHGMPTEEGFVVCAGSHAKANDYDSLRGGYKATKADLIKSGVLQQDPTNPDVLTFSQDYQFKSSTAAASVVAGSQRSGPGSWRHADGRLLKEVEAEEAAREVSRLSVES